MNKAVRVALNNIQKAELNLEKALKASYEPGSEIKVKHGNFQVSATVICIMGEKLKVRSMHDTEYWIYAHRIV